MFKIRKLISCAARHFCATNTQGHILEELKQRTLLCLVGDTVPEFLQGLTTNDVTNVDKDGGRGCMYTLFLNTKGRVLGDAIIYKPNRKVAKYLVECDVQIAERLLQHLKLYKMRKKIELLNLDDQMKVYALFNPNILDSVRKANQVSNIDLDISTNRSLGRYVETLQKDVMVFTDPRMEYLGLRVLCESSSDVRSKISEIAPLRNDNSVEYRFLRYNLGVGEGTVDYPVENCFPLESNVDFLNGISFNKGCYIGQELTARTYHTGVIRKRLMPIYFHRAPSRDLAGENIFNDEENLGKFRGVEKNVGLGLLRIEKSLQAGELKAGNHVGVVEKPFWWPKEIGRK